MKNPKTEVTVLTKIKSPKRMTARLISIDDERWDKVKDYAKKHNKSMAQVVRELIDTIKEEV